MKILFLSLILLFTACNSGSHSGAVDAKKPGQSDVAETGAKCEISGSDYSEIAGSFKNLNEATQNLMSTFVNLSLNRGCNADGGKLAIDIGRLFNVEFLSDGQVNVIYRNGEAR
jgi:hypothetical protein